MHSAAEEMKWMRGPSAPLRGVLLGLVLEHSGHSYELANRLVARLGGTWRINPSDVYRLLEQLEDARLVSSSEEPRRGARRGTHSVYFATDSTEGALALWMETLVPMAPVRVGLQAKLAVARAQDAPRLLVALRQYERECLDLLQLTPAASGAMPSWKALFMDCTRDAVDGQLRQEIAWAQHTRKRIREYAAAE
jgi:DNA-binding PadR family transcriptional regulator